MPAKARVARNALAAIGDGRWTTFVWGDSRAAMNRVVYAIAGSVDREFLWLDIRHPSDESVEPGPVELGWIPPDRLFLTKEPAEARPQRPVDPAVLWRVVRSDSPDHEVGAFADFLRLPAVTQKIVSGIDPSSNRRALVFANVERVREYYPRVADQVRPFMQAQLAAGLIPIYGLYGPTGPGRMACDIVLEVQTPDLRHWRDGALVIEKAPDGLPFRAGDRVPLPSIEALVDVFTRDRDWT